MLSQLFGGDQVLEEVAADRDRISRTQHQDDPAVGKVQVALLIRDPTCLPQFGADGNYGDETAGAVARFKVDELGVPPEEVIDDVGPRTVIRLDEIAAVAEGREAAGFAFVTAAGASATDVADLLATIDQVGGEILVGLGERAAVVDGGQFVLDALTGLVGTVLSGVVTPAVPELPGDVDEETALLLEAWLATLDPVELLDQLDPAREELELVSPDDGCDLEDPA
jgi:hypothetical protein